MPFVQTIRRFFHPSRELLPLMSRQASLLCQSSEALAKMMSSSDPSLWQRCGKEIKACEVQGDALLTEIRESPLRGPFRGTDFQTIAMSLDDCIDVIKDASKAVIIYGPRKIDPQLQELAQIIGAEAKAILDLVPLLENIRHNSTALTLHCDRITELEHTADDVYGEYIGFIFTEEQDFREMTKYKNLAELLEKATDSEKHVSDCIRLLLLRFLND